MEPPCDLLFVYGTLKRGLANHHQLGGAAFLGEAELPGVQLHDLGPFPMAILGDGHVRGELYRVDAARLAHLDRFEGVPRLYRRECRPLADGRQAWIYLGEPRQVRQSPLLEQGHWPALARLRPVAESGSVPLLAQGCRRSLRPGRSEPSRVSGCRTGALNSALVGAWRPLALLTALLGTLPLPGLQPVRAEASLAQCQRWQRSSGLERIQLGNAIGAAAYLTKQQRFAESDPQHPQLLYAPSDLQRACAGWR